jgi:hypothetical protein
LQKCFGILVAHRLDHAIEQPGNEARHGFSLFDNAISGRLIAPAVVLPNMAFLLEISISV